MDFIVRLRKMPAGLLRRKIYRIERIAGFLVLGNAVAVFVFAVIRWFLRN